MHVNDVRKKTGDAANAARASACAAGCQMYRLYTAEMSADRLRLSALTWLIDAGVTQGIEPEEDVDAEVFTVRGGLGVDRGSG